MVVAIGMNIWPAGMGTADTGLGVVHSIDQAICKVSHRRDGKKVRVQRAGCTAEATGKGQNWSE